MNCAAIATRETHQWMVPNIASAGEYPITHSDCQYMQIGETYFVEDGRREDRELDDYDYFSKGSVMRQRVSRTGAFVDHDMPLFYKEGLRGGSILFERSSQSQRNLQACIHSTCIIAVFFQPGTTALLQDGLFKYCTKYKINCMKSEEYLGPLPLNPAINVMQPKCLRGKQDDGGYWSVEKANKQLLCDRGVLRRNLSMIGSDDYLVQMPWCNLPLLKCTPSPIAVRLTGLDQYPIFLYGEPSLPSSEDYGHYISSLEGKIDPEFLQENVIQYGDFAVPFGSKRGKFLSHLFDGHRHPGIGEVWTREVDEEMKRMDSLQKEKKPSQGKKRKAPSKISAS
jgi:hypothetical protein